MNHFLFLFEKYIYITIVQSSFSLSLSFNNISCYCLRDGRKWLWNNLNEHDGCLLVSASRKRMCLPAMYCIMQSDQKRDYYSNFFSQAEKKKEKWRGIFFLTRFCFSDACYHYSVMHMMKFIIRYITL